MVQQVKQVRTHHISTTMNLCFVEGLTDMCCLLLGLTVAKGREKWERLCAASGDT
jgi:hypothetical protein